MWGWNLEESVPYRGGFWLIHGLEGKEEYKVISLEVLNFLLLIPKIFNFQHFFKFHHAK